MTNGAEDSVADWVDEVGYKLLGGERLLLRLGPRTGKSHLLARLGASIGSSCVYVDGKLFTEANQAEKREEVRGEIEHALMSDGSAQLLFDSYDKALSRSQGARLQAWLTSLLVDGSNSQDIGALFTSRCSTDIHKSGAGSPLMSRVVPIDAPTFPALDSQESGLREWFGNGSLFHLQVTNGIFSSPVSLADKFENDMTFLEDVWRASSAIFSRGSVSEQDDSYAARSGAYGLFDVNQETRLLKRVRVPLELEVDDPAWPDVWQSSVRKFSRLVAGVDEFLWVDRYMYRDIEPLRRFLIDLGKNVGCSVRLLGCREVSSRQVSKAEMSRLSLLPNVEARWMTESDFKDLHDRHLVLSAGGWVLPQVHVIVGRQSPGSTVAAPVTAFGIDYRSVWRNSILP